MNKKTIKEFLKPTKKKILLFVILFFVICASFNTYPAGSKSDPYCALYFGSDFAYDQSFELPFGGTSILCIVGPWILQIIISYLFSCLIVFAYNKLKTKNKN